MSAAKPSEPRRRTRDLPAIGAPGARVEADRGPSQDPPPLHVARLDAGRGF